MKKPEQSRKVRLIPLGRRGARPETKVLAGWPIDRPLTTAVSTANTSPSLALRLKTDRLLAQ